MHDYKYLWKQENWVSSGEEKGRAYAGGILKVEGSIAAAVRIQCCRGCILVVGSVACHPLGAGFFWAIGQSKHGNTHPSQQAAVPSHWAHSNPVL